MPNAAIEFGKGQSSRRGSGQKMQDGVYIDKGSIKEALIEYEAKKFESWDPDDVALRFKLGVDGLDFDKDLYIGGNWRKEGTSQGGKVVSGVGTAFKVIRVFDELEIIGEVDNKGQIKNAQDIVEQLISRELFVLRYVAYEKDDGKAGYRDYDIVAAQGEGESEEETRQRLFGEWQNDSYVQENQYRPDLLNDGSTSFEFGENAKGEDDNFAAEEDEYEFDDDLF